jgi:hypothetical protein
MLGLCAYSLVKLLPSGYTNATGNSARRGGAAALDGTTLIVQLGHTLTAQHNAAQLHGGAVALFSGASLVLEAAVCSSLCRIDLARESTCRPECLSSPCNWGKGGCVKQRMDAAGAEAGQVCDRDQCQIFSQTHARVNFHGCSRSCFSAACDWSREVCEAARSNVSACPLIDAAAYASIKSAQR